MIPGAKGLYTIELAHVWVKDLLNRQNMGIKVGQQSRYMRMFCRIVIVRSTNNP